MSLAEGGYAEGLFLGVVMLGAVRGSVIMLSVTVLSKMASRKIHLVYTVFMTQGPSASPWPNIGWQDETCPDFQL